MVVFTDLSRRVWQLRFWSRGCEISNQHRKGHLTITHWDLSIKYVDFRVNHDIIWISESNTSVYIYTYIHIIYIYICVYALHIKKWQFEIRISPSLTSDLIGDTTKWVNHQMRGNPKRIRIKMGMWPINKLRQSLGSGFWGIISKCQALARNDSSS